MILNPTNSAVAYFPSFVNEEGGVIEGGEGMSPWMQQTGARVKSRMKYVSL